MNIEEFLSLYDSCPVCKSNLEFNIDFSIFDSKAIVSYMMEDKFSFRKSFLHHATSVDSIINSKNIKLQSYSETVYEDSSDYFIYNPETKRSYFNNDYKDSKKIGVHRLAAHQYGHFEYLNFYAKCKKMCIRYFSKNEFNYKQPYIFIKDIIVHTGKYTVHYVPEYETVFISNFESLKKYTFRPSSLDFWPLDAYKLETRLLAIDLLK